MKFSTLFSFSTLVAVAFAAPKPIAQDTGMDVECAQTYCVPMANELTTCAEKYGYINSDGTVTTKDTYDQGFLDCVCVAGRSNYDNCLGCFNDKSLMTDYTGEFNKMCGTTSSTKKNAASSDKFCSWRMVGLAVAGGVIAAI